jgi:teichuronic acid biosynthesis glycosyltransferase TuaC
MSNDATMNVLVFTSLYPNAVQPNLGVFVENRTRRLHEAGVNVEVMAPVFVPIEPLSSLKRFAKALPPLVETRHGITVHHPRVPHLPGAWSLNPAAMTRACLAPLLQLRQSFEFEVMDAHYFFPDGVAAARLADRLGVPLMITARGSDITDWPNRPRAKKMILQAADKASRLAAVSASLTDDMVALGMPRAKTHLLRNGVDLEHFAPLADRAAARAKWQMQGFAIVSVGALVKRKGHDLTIAALVQVPDAHLYIAGYGPEQKNLEQLAEKLGVSQRLHLLGPVPHRDLPLLYGAADVSVLASHHEGLANALLEAIACGTAVIATNIDGAPEVLDDPHAGILFPVGDAAALTQALTAYFLAPLSRQGVRTSAERFSWRETTAAQIAHLSEIIVSRLRTY